MVGHRTRIVVALLFAVCALLAIFLLRNDLPSVAMVKEHREQLLAFIRSHYLGAVCSFMGIYLAAAFFMPGALALTVAGGLMFGTLPTLIYVNVGATTGAALAFLAARHLLGTWIQERFAAQLKRVNAEMANHGRNYLLMLRILPVVPFFAVNYGAGLSKIPLRTFVWATSLGLIPGSLVYANIGQQLRNVNATEDLLSAKIILGLVLIALLALAPVLRRHLPGRKGR